MVFASPLDRSCSTRSCSSRGSTLPLGFALPTLATIARRSRSGGCFVTATTVAPPCIPCCFRVPLQYQYFPGEVQPQVLEEELLLDFLDEGAWVVAAAAAADTFRAALAGED